jgi:hypothetical protein
MMYKRRVAGHLIRQPIDKFQKCRDKKEKF